MSSGIVQVHDTFDSVDLHSGLAKNKIFRCVSDLILGKSYKYQTNKNHSEFEGFRAHSIQKMILPKN